MPRSLIFVLYGLFCSYPEVYYVNSWRTRCGLVWLDVDSAHDAPWKLPVLVLGVEILADCTYVRLSLEAIVFDFLVCAPEVDFFVCARMDIPSVCDDLVDSGSFFFSLSHDRERCDDSGRWTARGMYDESESLVFRDGL